MGIRKFNISESIAKCKCIKNAKFKNNMNFNNGFEYGYTENPQSKTISVSYDDGRFVTISKETFNTNFEIIK